MRHPVSNGIRTHCERAIGNMGLRPNQSAPSLKSRPEDDPGPIAVAEAKATVIAAGPVVRIAGAGSEVGRPLSKAWLHGPSANSIPT